MQFTSLINCMLELLALLLKLVIILTNVIFKGLINLQDNLLINYTLGFTIYLGSNVVITTRPSSHKSKFIYHIIIVYY